MITATRELKIVSCLSVRSENMSTKTPLYQNGHCSFIHNSQQMEIVQLSFNMKLDKQIVVYSYTEFLLNNKKE